MEGVPELDGAPRAVDEPGGCLRLFASLHLVIGAGLLAIAIEPQLSFGGVSFGAEWARAVIGVLGAPIAFLGIRGFFRRPLTAEEVVRLAQANKRRVWWLSGIEGACGLALLGLGVLGSPTSRVVAVTEGGATCLAFAGGWLLFSGMLKTGAQKVAEKGVRRRRIEQSGRRGRGKILAVRDTGATINESPSVELDLDVTVEGSAPYRTLRRCTVPRLMVGRLVPGGSLPVRIDPTDANALLVEWDEP